MNKKWILGQALVEHLVLWPTLILLSMAAIQLGFLFRGRSTLEAATFMAAREGSINNAFKAPMKKMLARAMAPLDIKANPNAGHYAVVAGVGSVPGTTYGNNFLLSKALGGADIEIISPTKAIFNQFAKNQYELESCTSGCPGGGSFRETTQPVKQIPNDNLSVRSATVAAVGSTQINIQDANLLKIRAHWCFPLKVPIVNLAIFETMNLLGPATAELASCSAKTLANNTLSGGSIYYIPISASSVVRMQSAVRCEDASCSNLGGGGAAVAGGGDGGTNTGGTDGETSTAGNAGNGGTDNNGAGNTVDANQGNSPNGQSDSDVGNSTPGSSCAN